MTWEKSRIKEILFEGIGVVILPLLLFQGARITFEIPGMEVPITLQSFALVVVPWFYSVRAMLLGSLIYIWAGSIGLPVFSGENIGWAVWQSPSAGFLAGFPIIAILIAWVSKKRMFQNTYWPFVVFILAHLLLLIIGCSWIIFRVEWSAAMSTFVKLLPGGLAKSLLGGAVVWLANKKW